MVLLGSSPVVNRTRSKNSPKTAAAAAAATPSPQPDGNQGDVQREQEDVGTSLEAKIEDVAKEDGSRGKSKKGKRKR